MPLRHPIQNLDDTTAQHILTVVARSRLATGAEIIQWTDSLQQALRDSFTCSPSCPPASRGDVARHALVLLAEDPSMALTIDAMAGQAPPAPSRYDIATTVTLTGAVLVALQTHIR